MKTEMMTISSLIKLKFTLATNALYYASVSNRNTFRLFLIISTTAHVNKIWLKI